MKKYLFPWLFSFLVVSIIFGTIYKVGRVALDSALYDPLTTTAIDKAWAVALLADKEGKTIGDTAAAYDVELRLQPFITIYDQNKKVVSSTGKVDGQTPEVPAGILDNTIPEFRNYFDWEPKKDVHVAGVAVSIGKHGYIVVGQNMQEADRQAARLNKMVWIGWGASVVVMTAGYLVASHQKRK